MANAHKPADATKPAPTYPRVVYLKDAGIRSGESYNAEAYTETSYSLVIRPLQGVDIDIASTDWTLSLDDVKKRVLAPAAAQLANNIDSAEEEKALEGDWHDTPGEAMKAGAPKSGGAAQSETRRTEEWPTESEKRKK